MDGVTIRINKSLLDSMFYINHWWCNLTNYTLERTDYQKIIFSTVNDYLAIKTNGEIKKKGDMLTDFELYKNKSARIVPIALEHYFINGVNVSDTIRNHNNIYDFCLRQKASKDFHYEGENRLTGSRQIYNKLIRYYVSNKGEKLHKMKNPDYISNAANDIQIEAGEWVCKVCNYLSKDTDVKTADINFQYYIERAEKIIWKIQTGGKKEKPSNKVIPGQLNIFD